LDLFAIFVLAFLSFSFILIPWLTYPILLSPQLANQIPIK
jgi:hypothetical protein